MLRPEESRRFRGVVYLLGILRAVDVPPEISRWLNGGKYVPVYTWVGGEETQTTRVPRGNGRHRLFLSVDLLKRFGVDVGSEVEVAISADRESREPGMAADLLEALRNHPVALEVYQTATMAIRREFAGYLAQAKSPITRQRRIETVVRHLLARRKRR